MRHNPFLTPMRRMFELVMAGFGTGLGLFIWGQALAGHNAIAWAEISLDEALSLAHVIAAGGLIHALGIWINGRWNWSPFLRLAGILVHLFVLTALAIYGAKVHSTDAYIMPFLIACFAAATSFIGRDCVASLQRHAEWKHS